MADQSDIIKKNYEAALKSAEGLVTKTKEHGEALKGLEGYLNDITTAFLGLSTSDFFKEVEKTPVDLARSAEQIKNIKNALKETDKALANSFKGSDLSSLFDNLNKFKRESSSLKVEVDLSQARNGIGILDGDFDKLKKQMSSLREGDGILKNAKNDKQALEGLIENFDTIKGGINGINKDQLKEMLLNYKNLESSGQDLSKSFGDEFQKNFLLIDNNFEDSIIKSFIEYGDDVEGFIKENAEQGIKFLNVLADGDEKLLESLKIHGDITKQLEHQLEIEKKQTKEVFDLMKGLDKMAKNSLAGIKGFLLAYDSAVSDAQTSTGIMFKENSAAMADLASHNAALGMSIAETTAMMGDLSDKLNTTDFGVLSKASKDWASISGAMGVSSTEITAIGGEMMRFGASSEDVKDSFKSANVSAKALGISSKNLVKQIGSNLTKMREFGFTGGVKSLQKMATEAERLGIQVDEIFNVAKKARSIEGAMEMAAELQLAGGSFASINPMDLLSAARKGPEELGAILTKMGGDIGKFNDKNEFEFDAVDVDRLQIVANATGMSLDALQKTISKNAEDNKKLKLFPGSMLEMDKMSSEQKKIFTSLTQLSKDGKAIEFKQDSKTLSMLQKAGISTRDLSKLTAAEMTKFEEQMRLENENLEAQNERNASLSKAWDRLGNSLMAIFAVFEPVINWLAEVVGDLAQYIGNLSAEAKKWLGFGLAVVALGVVALKFTSAIGLFSGSIGSLLKGGLSKLTGGFLGKGGGGPVEDLNKTDSKMPAKSNSGGFLSSLAEGVKKFKPSILKNVATLALSMIMIGGALVGFSYAMAKFGGEASMEQMVTMGASLLLLGGSVVLLSNFSKGIDKAGLLTMSLAMAIIGAAMIPFAYAANMMKGVDMLGMLGSLYMLSAATIALALVGSTLLSTGAIVGVLAMAGMFLAISAGLLLFAVAAQTLGNVNWSGFSAMGPALLTVIPGMLGFALASMVFANPIAMVGMLAMTGVLIGLTAIMTPLASALTESSAGFATFATNMGLMADAVAKFDVSKFEKIAEASSNMASNSAGSGISGIIGNLFGGGASGGGGAGGTTPQTVVHEHVITLKIDGREIQRLIIKDNELLS